MTAPIPTVYFFEGIHEEIDNVSLRRDRASGARIVRLSFTELKAISRFNSFSKKFSNALYLTDEEGAISIAPSSVKFIFGGPEGDDFERLDCQFEITRDDHWERLMRFMNRYAEFNGMAYGEPETGAS
ncbi:MAG: photosystem II reaction center protein Psb28 [Leptolyngbyaceae bacterium]|nr:photosystem II reaction center protein Psb28 [Leptolyngbyaceae bacterium]